MAKVGQNQAPLVNSLLPKIGYCTLQLGFLIALTISSWDLLLSDPLLLILMILFTFSTFFFYFKSSLTDPGTIRTQLYIGQNTEIDAAPMTNNNNQIYNCTNKSTEQNLNQPTADLSRTPQTIGASSTLMQNVSNTSAILKIQNQKKSHSVRNNINQNNNNSVLMNKAGHARKPSSILKEMSSPSKLPAVGTSGISQAIGDPKIGASMIGRNEDILRLDDITMQMSGVGIARVDEEPQIESSRIDLNQILSDKNEDEESSVEEAADADGNQNGFLSSQQLYGTQYQDNEKEKNYSLLKLRPGQRNNEGDNYGGNIPSDSSQRQSNYDDFFQGADEQVQESGSALSLS